MLKEIKPTSRQVNRREKKSHAIVIKYKDKDKKCREEIALGSDIGSDSDVHSSQPLRRNCSTRHTKYQSPFGLPVKSSVSVIASKLLLGAQPRTGTGSRRGGKGI